MNQTLIRINYKQNIPFHIISCDINVYLYIHFVKQKCVNNEYNVCLSKMKVINSNKDSESNWNTENSIWGVSVLVLNMLIVALFSGTSSNN